MASPPMIIKCLGCPDKRMKNLHVELCLVTLVMKLNMLQGNAHFNHMTTRISLQVDQTGDEWRIISA